MNVYVGYKMLKTMSKDVIIQDLTNFSTIKLAFASILTVHDLCIHQFTTYPKKPLKHSTALGESYAIGAKALPTA